MFSRGDKVPSGEAPTEVQAEPPSTAPEPERPRESSRKRAQGDSGISTTLSTDTKVIGDLESQGEIRVEGRVEGKVTCNSLNVSEGGHIEGSVLAETVRVQGSVNGHIGAKAVTLLSTANVRADILYQDLAVETGARFEGGCHRTDKTTSGGRAKA